MLESRVEAVLNMDGGAVGRAVERRRKNSRAECVDCDACTPSTRTTFTMVSCEQRLVRNRDKSSAGVESGVSEP